jgi:hypothetical protein
MKKHRLDRLANLTKGAALVSVGALSFACNDTSKTINSPPQEPIHVNATATPTPLDASPPPNPTTSASSTAATDAPDAAGIARAVPHTINAPPRPRASAPSMDKNDPLNANH